MPYLNFSAIKLLYVYECRKFIDYPVRVNVYILVLRIARLCILTLFKYLGLNGVPQMSQRPLEAPIRACHWLWYRIQSIPVSPTPNFPLFTRSNPRTAPPLVHASMMRPPVIATF